MRRVTAVTRPLFERYKEALRRGHLALLAGNMDEALAAYGEAARIVPDRALPHTSMAGVLHRSGRAEEAQQSFARALELAPDDEPTLRARATTLEELGRASSAAIDLEHLALVLDAAGHRREALDLARRALALAPSTVRAQLVERLEAPEEERAGPPPVPPLGRRPTGLRAATFVPSEVGSTVSGERAETSQLEAAEAAAADRAIAAFDLSMSDDMPPDEPEVEAQPAIPWPAIDLPSPPPPPLVGPPPDVQVLMGEAEALLDAGDLRAARDLMLTAIAIHRAAGRPDAALDVCLQLLAIAPGDSQAHLAIAGLQLDRGWQGLATEKIQLLLRLTSLTGDTQAEADVHALAAERVRDEPPAGFARS